MKPAVAFIIFRRPDTTAKVSIPWGRAAWKSSWKCWRESGFAMASLKEIHRLEVPDIPKRHWENGYRGLVKDLNDWRFRAIAMWQEARGFHLLLWRARGKAGKLQSDS